MRAVYTVQPGLGPLARAYVRLLIDGHVVPAIIDTGADASVIPQHDADMIGLGYERTAGTVGVGGPVQSGRALRPVDVTIAAPRPRGRAIEWIEIGSHLVVPTIVASPLPMPALVGRTDLLVHYRFTLIERDRVFELTPVR